MDNKNNSLEEAATKYGSVSMDEFFDELDDKIKEHFKNA